MAGMNMAELPKNAKGLSICLMFTTLVRLIMTGYIVAGKNNGGYKYGGIAEKPPNLTRHNTRTKVITKQQFYYIHWVLSKGMEPFQHPSSII